MALFNANKLRESITKTSIESAQDLVFKAYLSPDQEFDIFLCHCYKDAKVILGLSEEIERMGYYIYVDWVKDADLDRGEVSRKTAERLRKRMNKCRSMFFATSTNAIYSKWMPWECGYFDGINGKVAICPIAEENTSKYEGREYLNLYPYVDVVRSSGSEETIMWINQDTKYVSFDRWIKGEEPREH